MRGHAATSRSIAIITADRSGDRNKSHQACWSIDFSAFLIFIPSRFHIAIAVDFSSTGRNPPPIAFTVDLANRRMKLHLVASTLLVLASVVPVAAGRNNLRRGHLNNLAAFEEEVVDIVSFASACYLPHFLLLATTSGSGKVTTFFCSICIPRHKNC